MKVLFRGERKDNGEFIEGLLIKKKYLEYLMTGKDDSGWSNPEDFTHCNSYAIQYEGYNDHLEVADVEYETIEQLVKDDGNKKTWEFINREKENVQFKT